MNQARYTHADTCVGTIKDITPRNQHLSHSAPCIVAPDTPLPIKGKAQ